MGLPLIVGRSKREIFSYIRENVDKRLASWKNKLLSKAGKEILIKAVIGALSIYTMSCFKLLTTICKEIERLTSRF